MALSELYAQNVFTSIDKINTQEDGVDKQIYFCMESDDVWRATLGYTPKDIGGLANHLIQLSFAPFQSTT